MKRSPMTRKTPMRRTAMKPGQFAIPKQPGTLKAHWDDKPNPNVTKLPGWPQPVPAKRSGLKRSSSLRAQQRRQYTKLRKAYLLEHPYCQITIFMLGLNEAEVIKQNGVWYLCSTGNFLSPQGAMAFVRTIPNADQIHHRNRCNGVRLINFNYVISSCAEMHRRTEENPAQSREMGLLCPINCKPDGTMPDGTKQPTTTELLAQRHAAKSP